MVKDNTGVSPLRVHDETVDPSVEMTVLWVGREKQRYQYSNHIHGSAIDESMAFFEKHGISIEKAREARQIASDTHNKEETPNFAKSLERKALAK
jgi:hypothetical protein